MKKTKKGKQSEIVGKEDKIIKSSKKPMVLQTKKDSGNIAEKILKTKKVSKRERELLKLSEALVGIGDSIRSTKISVEKFADRVFQRKIENFKGFSVNPNGTVESYAMDAIEAENASCLYDRNDQLSWEIISKYQQTFIGWQNCAILKQNPIIDNACSLPPQDAMASGYKVAFAETGKKAKIGELERFVIDSQKKYQIKDVCVQAAINCRVFGWSLVIPTFNKEVDMEREFDINDIEKGSYTGMAVVEPYWITYDFDKASFIDPTSKYFYQPTWYSFPISDTNGDKGFKRIHRSWCIKLINSNVPDILKPTYFFGGIPTTQQIYEAVYAYEKALNECLLLLLTKRSFVADAEMANYLTNSNEVNRLLSAMSEIHDNYGVWIKQIGTEIKQMDTTLTGLEEVVSACMQRVSAIAQMPAEKLFKLAVKGLNSSGTYEQNDYKQLLIRIQKDKYIPIIDRHNLIMSKSDSGKEKNLIVEFNPVDTPDELTMAQIRNYDAKTTATRLGAFITSRKEERERLITDSNGGFTTLDPNPPEIDKQQASAFSVEKDNQGRPMPKEINNPTRPLTKEDVAKKKRLKQEEEEQSELEE